MPVPTETGAAFRVRNPAQLVRGADSVSRLEAALGSTAASGTFAYRLLGPEGDVIASGITGSLVDGVASASIVAASLPSTLGYGRGYREEWTITLASAAVLVVTRPAALVRYVLHCPITLADLQAKYPDLEAWVRTSSSQAPQFFIDSAWEDLMHRLAGDGRWVNTIIDVDQLVVPVRELALATWFRFRSATTGVDSQDDRLALRHEEAFRNAYGQLRFTEDKNQDGVADDEGLVAASCMVLRRSMPRTGAYNVLGGRPRRGVL